jgi:hypothetical protein
MRRAVDLVFIVILAFMFWYLVITITDGKWRWVQKFIDRTFDD